MEKLPELLDILDQQKESVLKDLVETLTINDIEKFAQAIQDSAQDHNYPPLIKWGKQLGEYAGLFDMDAMSKTLEYFPNIIQDIKSKIETILHTIHSYFSRNN